MGKRVSFGFKAMAVTAVLMGRKQVTVCKFMDIPESSLSAWMRDPQVLAHAQKAVEPAKKVLARKMAGKLGGLARWGKYTPPSKEALAAPEKKKRKYSEEGRAARSASRKAYWDGLSAEDRELRIMLMQDGRKKKAKTA